MPSASSGGASRGIAAGGGGESSSRARNSFGRSAPDDAAPARRSSFSEPAQGLLVAVEELHLELAEAPGDVLADQDGDGVVDDLGATRPNALASGAEAGNRLDAAAPEVRREERQHLERRPRRRAALLELDAGRASRELQLPDARPVLDAATERDAMTGEDEVRRVVICRDEHAARERSPPSSGSTNPSPWLELQLPLQRLLHRVERNPESSGRATAARLQLSRFG